MPPANPASWLALREAQLSEEVGTYAGAFLSIHTSCEWVPRFDSLSIESILSVTTFPTGGNVA